MLRRLGLALLWCGCFADPGTDADDDADGDASTGGTSSTAGPSTSTSTSASSTTDSTSADPSSSGSEGDTMACPVGAVAGPDVFAGWEGPIVLVGTDDEELPPPCPPELGDDGEVGIGPSAQPCVCTCAPTCRFDEREASTCVGPGGVAQGLLAPGCNNLGSSIFVDYYTAGSAQAVGDCATPTAVPSAAAWDATFRACLAPVDAECVPRPAGAIGPCIRREGDHECPFAIAEKHVVFAEPPIICGGCGSCELAAHNACATDSIVGYSEADCRGDMTMPFPDCSPIAIASIEYVPPIPDCTPSRSMLGELMPITYCCV